MCESGLAPRVTVQPGIPPLPPIWEPADDAVDARRVPSAGCLCWRRGARPGAAAPATALRHLPLPRHSRPPPAPRRQIRRPNNYDPGLAIMLGPVDPNPCMDLPRMGIIRTMVQVCEGGGWARQRMPGMGWTASPRRGG